MELSLVPETIPPRAQVQCPLEIIHLGPSRDVAVLDFSYKFGTDVVHVKLRLPAVLNKFLQPISVSAEEFSPQWRSFSGLPLKLHDELIPLLRMITRHLTKDLMVECIRVNDNDIMILRLTEGYLVRPDEAFVPTPYLIGVRNETDPADRTQLRMTVSSGDPTLTFELKEFIKEQLVSIPTTSQRPARRFWSSSPIRSARQHPRYLSFINGLLHFPPKYMHLHTEVPAPYHRGALHLPPTGVHHTAHQGVLQVRHFASCHYFISSPLCSQLERSPSLIKLRAKETRFGGGTPFAVQLLKIDLVSFL
ncbi:adaptor protein complex AP-2, alpha subunit [Actinidia rufa]|uniref:Adaptor protein complex AP-2, alpha subunit n=1 Tax=Actinidia rufa TaxID=165716 RepID=A0A7J0FMS0_9ERIC|nr:adaptor protein complex AP-2, alpha subunit [Actinidia rufa]